MHPLRLAAFLLLLTCLPMTGCISFHITRLVEVTATHADTGDPLVSAPIEVDYRYFLTLNAPEDVSTTADVNGQAILPMADFGGMICLRVAGMPFSLRKVHVRDGTELSARDMCGDEAPPVEVRLVPLE